MRVAGRGVGWQTVAGRATVAGFPGQLRWPLGSGPSFPEPLASASSWYDARDITSATQQTLPNRVGAGVATFGSTAGSDFNDPVRFPHDGTNYVYLPGTASNNLSVPKDGGWAGTLHVTATLIDDTTATFTTTASPILIGNTLLGAGRYKRFDVRDTDGAGTLRVTIDLATETLGQTGWTCTTGQTVTVNRSTSGLTTAVVTRPNFLCDDVDDFLQLPLSDIPSVTHATGGFTVLVAHRYWNQPGSPGVWGSGPSIAQGLALYHSGVTLVATARSATQSLTNSMSRPLPGAFACKGLVADSGNYRPYVSGLPEDPFNSMTGLTNLNLSTVAGPRINSAHAEGMSAPFGGEYFAVVQWPRALTQAELDQASAFLLGTYA